MPDLRLSEVTFSDVPLSDESVLDASAAASLSTELPAGGYLKRDMARVQSLLQKTLFLKSAAKLTQCPEDLGREVAFVGRSNAGKSSAINALCRHTRLARTSKTPGRTQLLNFFTIDDPLCRLVDLPGYGYAKVSLQIKKEWHQLLDAYFKYRQSLVGIIVLMDIRHPLQPVDHTLLTWAQHYKKPAHILLTKADKLSKGPVKTCVLNTQKALETLYPQACQEGLLSVQAFSSPKRVGLENACSVLDQWLWSTREIS